MAFELYNWSQVSTSLNQGVISAAIATETGDSVIQQGSGNLFSYFSPNDTVAEIGASNYFLEMIYSLQVYDNIICTGTDASLIYQVATITLPSEGSTGTITTVDFTPAGTVGTANITNLAVTTAKIANNAVTAAQIANNTVDYGQLALDVAATATVTLTAAQIAALYATPLQLIAAPGSGNLILIDSILWDIAYSTAQYTAGGAIAAQYGNTAHGAGPAASATLAAATLNAVAANAYITQSGGAGVVNVAPGSALNTAVYLSNATAAFATGASTATLYIKYRVVTPA